MGHHGPVPVTLRPLTLDDAGQVLALNQEVVHKLAPMDEDRFRWFLEVAACAWAAEVDGAFAGFVLVLAPGATYDSANYRWFAERRADFLYLDRVAISERFRRRGVGSAVYDGVEAQAAAQQRPVVLEVNREPPNHGSLAFHAARGYREVGTLRHDDGKVVSLQEKLVVS
jgi:predicted GNAT superfamily acetyltransferase